MLTPLLKAFILLRISAAAQARPQAESSNDRWSLGLLDDWASSGNYLIYSCGSEAPTVKSLLDFAYLYLQTALRSTSTPPYKAFFHFADPASVSTILTTITLGINITISEHVSRRPTFVCVNERDEGIKKIMPSCRKQPGSVLIPQTDSAVIFLCPNFFKLAAAPDIGDCPRVNSADTQLVDTQLPGYSGIGDKQYKFLVQGLAIMYIKEMMGGEGTLRKDVGGDNPCLALPEYQALRNPSSYAYYAGYVRAGCTNFPSKVPIQHYRNLLAVDGAGAGNETSALTLEGMGAGNETGALTLVCVSNGTNSAPCPT